MRSLLNDRIKLIKKSGEIYENIRASVQSKIYVSDLTIPIQEDDIIERILPSKIVEKYFITKVNCYNDSELGHYEIEYRKDGIESTKENRNSTINNINIQGDNAKLNVNSQDYSTNNFVNNSSEIFEEIKKIINDKVLNDDKDLLVRELELMKKKKGTQNFIEHYQNFIAAGANHITLLAPFIPVLTQMIKK